MTTTPAPEVRGTNWTALAAPFPADALEFRIMRSGIGSNGKPWALVVAYVTARAIQDRLDAVVGPGNWQVGFREWPLGVTGVMCDLALWIDRGQGHGEWVTKTDGAEQPKEKGGPDALPVAVKGGFSAAFKRAAVAWGIGRYLYQLPETFALIRDGGAYFGQAKPKGGGEPTRFKWDPPDLPAWALPEGAAGAAARPTAADVEQGAHGEPYAAGGGDAAEDGVAGGAMLATPAQRTLLKRIVKASALTKEQAQWVQGKIDRLDLTKDQATDVIQKVLDRIAAKAEEEKQGSGEAAVAQAVGEPGSATQDADMPEAPPTPRRGRRA